MQQRLNYIPPQPHPRKDTKDRESQKETERRVWMTVCLTDQ